jgi:hypothetical protein
VPDRLDAPVRRAVPALAALGALAVALVAAVLLHDRSRSERIADGVRVAGVEVGGREARAAREVVRERVAVPAERDVVVKRWERTWELSSEDAGLEVDVEATVQDALRESRRGNPFGRTLRALTGGEVDADVEPRLSFDEDAVGEFVARVAEEADREVRDADIEPVGDRLEVVSERTGWQTDESRLRGDLEEALRRPRGEREMGVPGDQTDPDVTEDDLAERYPHYITIDRESFRLHHYEGLEKESTFRISVGDAGHHTPAGRYDISNKAVDPDWHVPDEDWAGDKRGEVIPPGPDNPIKSRWLGIEDGVGIHGTDEPESIGSRASRGCIRMFISDVEELYEKVPVETPVYID